MLDRQRTIANVHIDDDLPDEFPYLRTMEFKALHALFKDPRYGPIAISHLLTKLKDLQRHVLLNYVYAQSVEACSTADAKCCSDTSR
jgi:hypothetical protein